MIRVLNNDAFQKHDDLKQNVLRFFICEIERKTTENSMQNEEVTSSTD